MSSSRSALSLAHAACRAQHATESGHRWSCSEIHTIVEVDRRRVAREALANSRLPSDLAHNEVGERASEAGPGRPNPGISGGLRVGPQRQQGSATRTYRWKALRASEVAPLAGSHGNGPWYCDVRFCEGGAARRSATGSAHDSTARFSIRDNIPTRELTSRRENGAASAEVRAATVVTGAAAPNRGTARDRRRLRAI